MNATQLLYRWSRVAMEYMHAHQYACSKVSSSAGTHARPWKEVVFETLQHATISPFVTLPVTYCFDVVIKSSDATIIV